MECAGGEMVDDAERAGEFSGVPDATSGVDAGVRAALHPVTDAATHTTPTAMVAARTHSRLSTPLR